MKIKWTDIAENFVKEGTDINGNKVFGAINNTWTWDKEKLHVCLENL